MRVFFLFRKRNPAWDWRRDAFIWYGSRVSASGAGATSSAFVPGECCDVLNPRGRVLVYIAFAIVYRSGVERLVGKMGNSTLAEFPTEALRFYLGCAGGFSALWLRPWVGMSDCSENKWRIRAILLFDDWNLKFKIVEHEMSRNKVNFPKILLEIKFMTGTDFVIY